MSVLFEYGNEKIIPCHTFTLLTRNYGNNGSQVVLFFLPQGEVMTWACRPGRKVCAHLSQLCVLCLTLHHDGISKSLISL